MPSNKDPLPPKNAGFLKRLFSRVFFLMASKKGDKTILKWEKSFVVNLAGWILFFWCLSVVLFGWSVKNSVIQPGDKGLWQKISIVVASFPDMFKIVYDEIANKVSGEYEDSEFSVPRTSDYNPDEYTLVPSATKEQVEGFYYKGDPALGPRGWRFVAGVFTINGAIENAALLISPDFKIAKVWIVDEAPIEGGLNPREPYRRFVHGIDLLPDASIVFTFDGSTSLQRYDKCSNRLWGISGWFHHTVNFNPDTGTVWTFSDPDTIMEVDAVNGTTLRTFTAEDIEKANPYVSILNHRIKYLNNKGTNDKNTAGEKLVDAYHFNDVKPLTKEVSKAFKHFKAGDLILSARSLNLLFVIDPDTLEIKWWRSGQSQRQHDPDWLPDGTISVYNNRMAMDFSQITAIDPSSFRNIVLYNGDEKNQFYNRIRGQHQVLEDGRLLIASSQQGRIIETDPSGNIVMDMINLKKDDPETVYNISMIRWYPENAFSESGLSCE